MLEVPDKYHHIFQNVLRISKECGWDWCTGAIGSDRDGLNQFYPSGSEDILFIFDYGTLHEVRFPEGSSPVVVYKCGSGARVREGRNEEDVLTEFFGLQEVRPKKAAMDCQYSASGPIYKATKNILEVLP